MGKNQHYMPQFIQKEFECKLKHESQKKHNVKIYDKSKDKISIVSRKHNMSKPAIEAYGQYSNSFDEDLQKIESMAAPKIKEILDNPYHYTEINQSLPQEILDFIISMKYRSPNTINDVSMISDIFLEYANNEPNLKNNPVKEKLQDIKTHNDQLMPVLNLSELITSDKNTNSDIYSGKFEIITTDKHTPIFLSDQTFTGFIALSPHMILVYGEDCKNIVKKTIKERGKANTIDLYNFISIQSAYERVIINEQTTLWQIKKLYNKFEKLQQIIP